MPPHAFTRPELHALVWAEPMRTLAARLGVSDVGLAKACRRAIIPVPPRGHWAKLQYGKASPVMPLPEAKAAPERIVIAPPAPKPRPSPRAQAVLDTEAPPPSAVPEVLRRPHPIIRGWIDDNQERRREIKRNGWGFTIEDLSAGLPRRRLRLYAALFTALEAAKFKLTPAHSPSDGVSAHKAGEEIAFRIYERARKVRRPMTEAEKQWSWNKGKTDLPDLVGAGDLVLRIKTYTRGAMAENYRDQKAPLEQQLPAILVAFEAAIVELQTWRAERAAAEERWRQEQRAQAERAQRAKAQKARREQLLEEVQRWRQAQDLRAYVAAASASAAASMVDYPAWATWALKTAEAIDPLGGEGPDLRLLLDDVGL